MPMPRDYTIILNDLVEDEVLDAASVLKRLLNYLSEDEVYMFCKDEYDEITNAAYKSKYDMSDASNEDSDDD